MTSTGWQTRSHCPIPPPISEEGLSTRDHNEDCKKHHNEVGVLKLMCCLS
uniref:Uncharacterized protein n=1 Tax=Trichinella nativa TaxID=6335 RepID=A0A0V1KIJ0_9BILA